MHSWCHSPTVYLLHTTHIGSICSKNGKTNDKKYLLLCKFYSWHRFLMMLKQTYYVWFLHICLLLSKITKYISQFFICQFLAAIAIGRIYFQKMPCYKFFNYFLWVSSFGLLLLLTQSLIYNDHHVTNTFWSIMVCLKRNDV